MEEAHTARAEHRLVVEGETAEPGDRFGAELVAVPVGRRPVRGVRMRHHVVPVAAHDDGARLARELDDGPPPRALPDEVAAAPHRIRSSTLRVGECGLKGREVAVHVGDDGDAVRCHGSVLRSAAGG